MNGPMGWRQFAAAAPHLAERVDSALRRRGVALLGTLRGDGSPRISPIEPYFVADQLVLGVMARSLKAKDLLRDQRCVLHNAVTDVEGSEGEVKLYGRAVPADPEGIPEEGFTPWWSSQPRDAYHVFAMEISRATVIDWETNAGRMRIVSWSPQSGLRERTLSYP